MNRIALLVAAAATAVSLVGVAPAEAKSLPQVEGAAADCTAGTSCIITWTSGGAPIRVYEGTDPDAIDTSTPVATVDAGRTATVGGLDPTKRYYFALKSGDAKGPGTVVADRSLHLASAPNARDIGGYETKDGHHVKWGTIFRSDAISKADATSLPALTHCTAGKDRTGWSSAESLMADPSLLLPVLEVRPEYIAASFATVKQQYGTFDNYLRKGLGISKAELAKLKQNLLTD